MNILTEEPITDLEAKKFLEQKEGELKYEQKNSLEILKKSTKVDAEKVKKLIDDLKSFERLRSRQIVAIANFLPENKDDLRAVLHKEYTSFTPEEIDKILEIIKRNI